LTPALASRAHFGSLLARLTLGSVFILAGALKLGHSADLAATISAFRLHLAPQLIALIAGALPPFEILLGVYLLGGWLLEFTAWFSCALLCAFIVVLASVAARGLSAPCGCFGAGDTAPVSWWTVARDALLLVPATYLLWWERRD